MCSRCSRWKMEPQQQAFEVVEGVIANICEKLGTDAKEHICRVKLHESAKEWMENSRTVPEAIEAISSPLERDVQGKLELEKKNVSIKKIKDQLELEEKNFTIKKIRDELEKTFFEQMIVEKINKIFEQDTEPAEGEAAPGPGEADSEAAGPCATSQLESVSADKVTDVLVSKTSTSNSLHLDLPHDGQNNVDTDDDDVVILETVPRQAAPLIVLTDDDDDEGTSTSTSNDGVFIMNPTPNTSLGGQHTMEFGMATDITPHQQTDPNQAENSGLNNDSFANSHKADMTLNERIDDIKKEGKRNIDNADGEVEDMNELQRNDRLNIDAFQQPSSANVVDAVGGHGSHTNYPFLSQNLQHTLQNPTPPEDQLNACMDENRNRTHVADEMNYMINDHPDAVESSDLWEDAHYICSLLPYFTLRDVHQTMVENLHHPFRRAFVLEAYIKVAVDRQESVKDNVFQSLWAARKRSSIELTDPHTQVQKKLRTELEPEVDQAPYEVLPSTSNAGAAHLIVTEPDLATNINPGTFDPRMDEPLCDGWYKEKMDFLCAVVQIDKKVLWDQVLTCQTDADIEALLERILEDQDQFTMPAPPRHVENEPSTSAAPPAAVAGPSNVSGAIDSVARDEAVAGPSSEDATEGEDQGGQAMDVEDKILTQVKTLSEMFADADPDYLQERCVANNGDDAKFQEVLDELIKSNDYPKIEEYHKRQKRLEIKKKFIEGMSVEEFLQYFEDPEKVFSDSSTNMSPTYVENARTQLKRELPYHLIRDIESAFKKHNHHYLPTLRALQENGKLTRRKTKRTSNLKERDLDDIFIKELCYARMQAEIKEHLWKKEENKRRAFLLAKAANELQECRCCYNDEVLEEDMEPCNDDNTPHKFCVTCIRRFVEEEIGQGRTSFRCIEGDCEAEFSLTTLKRVMKPSIFSKILERKQLEEIAAAGIEDLVACPFCNFQTIMSNPEDKVFKCLNPECMKDSCRYCKEPNHVPLHCEEVEKQHQKDTRVFLENKMTEAMVRVCWKCQNRFIKEDGCNKMVCPCTAMMCYICKKPIKGYDHFDTNPNPTNSRKCPLWSNSKVIHAEEVRAAATKLKNELDPSVDLLHNPLQDLPEVPQHLIKHRVGQPAELPHAPPAHQQQVQGHLVDMYHRHHVVHRINQAAAAFHLPAPPPPPAHRQLPPAPPAHRQFPPVMQIGLMQPPRVMDMPEVNQFQHQHHHHHIHPIRQNPPPVHLPPTGHLRDNVVVHELLMEMRRNHDMQMRLWTRYMERTATNNPNNSSSSSSSSSRE